MLSRFAPNDIVSEGFKTISFNHVLLHKKSTRMYQVIFLPLLNCFYAYVPQMTIRMGTPIPSLSCCQARITFKYVLADSWFACESLIHAVRELCNGAVHYIGLDWKKLGIFWKFCRKKQALIYWNGYQL